MQIFVRVDDGLDVRVLGWHEYVSMTSSLSILLGPFARSDGV